MVTREKEQSSVSWDPFRCVGRALALLQTQAGRARHATFDQMAPVEYHSYPQPSVKPEVGSIDAAFFQMHSVPASDPKRAFAYSSSAIWFRYSLVRISTLNAIRVRNVGSGSASYWF